ncbi:hypothetical protein OSTOST_00094, partial [Ostertagia ostertagi]
MVNRTNQPTNSAIKNNHAPEMKPENVPPKATSNVSSVPFSGNPISSTGVSTSLLNKTVSSNPSLDINRRSRVESEISNALPPPSELFFAKATNETDRVVNNSSSSGSAHGRTNSIVLPTSGSSSSRATELLLSGVLEPVRLPITSRSLQLSNVANIPTSEVSQRDSSRVPLNFVAPQPGQQRQLPLFTLTNNAPTAVASPLFYFGM